MFRLRGARTCTQSSGDEHSDEHGCMASGPGRATARPPVLRRNQCHLFVYLHTRSVPQTEKNSQAGEVGPATRVDSQSSWKRKEKIHAETHYSILNTKSISTCKRSPNTSAPDRRCPLQTLTDGVRASSWRPSSWAMTRSFRLSSRPI